MRRLSILAVCSVSLAPHIAAAAPHNVGDFDWSSLEPSASLNYTQCYDGHKCARLLVPMDWLNEDGPASVTLAIVARPAVVDEGDPSFGGTIIVNPGGPSGSGVEFLLNRGELLQNIADGDKKWEFLSFDPRGVGETLPRSDCFQDELARVVGKIEDRAIGSTMDGIDSLKRLSARVKAFGALCERDADSPDIHRFMSTSSVARDMIEIVDKIDELRSGKSSDADNADDHRLELREEKDLPRINYWGFSYGTVLGNYLASMFPGRVGRVALEAVCDVEDYYNVMWSRNLQDVGKTYEHLWDTCYKGGSHCALYDPEDSGPDDIRNRFEAFLEGLDESPAPHISGNKVEFVTKADLLKTIFEPLYSPMKSFPPLAERLSAAMHGNFSGVFENMDYPDFNLSCPLRVPDTYTWNEDAMRAIACGDGTSLADVTIEDFQEYLVDLEEQSPYFAPYWSSIRLGCTGWRARPEYRFTGPWTTPEHDAAGVKGKPLAPLLFVSSQYDPVTPLRNAHEMSKGHPGSGVLLQDSVGHGTIMTPGKCRDHYIKKYFEAGEVPPEGNVCEADCTPFQDCPDIPMTIYGNVESVEGSRRRSPLEMI